MPHKAIGSLIAVLTAELAPTVNRVAQLHVPPIIMESFQCIAWFSAFVIAIVAVFRYRKENKESKEDE